MSPVVALLAGSKFAGETMLHRSGRPFTANELAVVREATEADFEAADRVRRRLVDLHEDAASAWGEVSDVMSAYFQAYPACKTTEDVRPHLSEAHRNQVDGLLRRVSSLDDEIEQIDTAIGLAL